MNIRLAQQEEAPLISDLALRSKGYWGYDSHFLSLCKEELTYSKEDFVNLQIYLLQTSEVVGFYALSPMDNKSIELEALFIDPKHIGLGYGYQLLLHAIETAKQLGALEMLVIADPFAMTFYQKHGAKYLDTIESKSIAGRHLPRLNFIFSAIT